MDKNELIQELTYEKAHLPDTTVVHLLVEGQLFEIQEVHSDEFGQLCIIAGARVYQQQ